MRYFKLIMGFYLYFLTISACYGADVVIFFDDFEDVTAFQNTWQFISEPGNDSTVGWTDCNSAANSNDTGGGGNCAIASSDDYCFSGCSLMHVSLVSPVLDFSMCNDVTLSFLSDFQDFNHRDYGYVEISTDNGNTWTKVFSYELQDYPGPRQEVIDLSAFAGFSQVLIKFRYYAPGWDWWWEIDNVTVTCNLSTQQGIQNGRMFGYFTLGNWPNFAAVDTNITCNGSITPWFSLDYFDGSVYHVVVAYSPVSVLCYDDPAFTPANPTVLFDSTEAQLTGMMDGYIPVRVEVVLKDGGEPGYGRDYAEITVRDMSNTIIYQTGGYITSGSIYAMPLY